MELSHIRTKDLDRAHGLAYPSQRSVHSKYMEWYPVTVKPGAENLSSHQVTLPMVKQRA